jgi:DNA-binding beta-propeller fold protein YncE
MQRMHAKRIVKGGVSGFFGTQMNPHTSTPSKFTARKGKLQAFLIALAANIGCFGILPSEAQVIFTTNISAQSISTYNAYTGELINASFITGLGGAPYDITNDGSHLYIANYASNKIGKYDAVTGAEIDANFVTGLTGPDGITYADGFLYVANYNTGSIGKFDAATGATIDDSFITGLNGPAYLEAHDGKLYIPMYDTGVVGLYDATTGAVINSSFMTGLSRANSITFHGGSAFVTDQGMGVADGQLAEFNWATGEAINLSLVGPLSAPQGVLVDGNGNLVIGLANGNVVQYTTEGVAVAVPWFNTGLALAGFDVMGVPEPGSCVLLCIGTATLLIARRRVLR